MWRISAVVIVGSIMSILDITIVNVALDTLADAAPSDQAMAEALAA